MASPKAHVVASAGLIALGYITHGFILSWRDIIWNVIFGVLIDIDHIPVGRLRRVFKANGLMGIREFWKKCGWFDANHQNFLHTWPVLAVVIIFSVIIVNVWPLVAYGIHMAIDGGNAAQLIYHRSSPLPRDIYRYAGCRFYPAWMIYYFVPKGELKKGGGV